MVQSQLARDLRLGDIAYAATDQVILPQVRRDGCWEPYEARWLDGVVEPGMTVVNVGAHVGYFAIWAAQLVGDSGRVYAVEPAPTNFELLERNLYSRGLQTRVVAVQAAASNAAGITQLHLDPANTGDHRVFEGSSEAREQISVRSLTVDELVGDDAVDVVMVDAQGWDHNVLRGMSGVIQRERPIVVTEYVPTWMAELGEDPGAFLDEVMSWGYQIGLLEAGVPPGLWGADQVLSWMGPRLFCNLELWPSEREFRPRAIPSDGFWKPESAASGYRQWQTHPKGIVRVCGPANSCLTVDFQLAPPPGESRELLVAGVPTLVAKPEQVSVSVLTDVKGHAELQIDSPQPAVRVQGDPRPLFLSISAVTASPCL